ncbi:MAG TPA: hypothetical protein VGR35_13775 [Tepidisphaeraceae bacterium]|nr:hypothetical protein [Tepidisphaeraceae bacterium]
MPNLPKFEPLERRQHLSTYYVSPGGSDRNPGTLHRPWKSIERVNKQAFRGGDRVLFQGGRARFVGNPVSPVHTDVGAFEFV